jgi:hypothetical protein
MDGWMITFVASVVAALVLFAYIRYRLGLYNKPTVADEPVPRWRVDMETSYDPELEDKYPGTPYVCDAVIVDLTGELLDLNITQQGYDIKNAESAALHKAKDLIVKRETLEAGTHRTSITL